MGTGASSDVKAITINQDDNQWDRYAKKTKRKNSTGSRVLSAVGDRIRKSADSSSRRSGSSADRKLQQARNAAEVSETKATDAEARVRQLERELGNLEHRNIELADEVKWLKQQLSGRPEVPLGSDGTEATQHRPDSSSSVKSIRTMDMIHAALKDKGKIHEEHVAHMNAKHQREMYDMRNEFDSTRLEMDLRCKEIEAKFAYECLLNQKLEAVVREKLTQSIIENCHTATREESKNGVSGPNADQIAELSLMKTQMSQSIEGNKVREDLRIQKDKVRHLEDDVIRRDLEIAHLKEVMELSGSRITSIHAQNHSLVAANQPKIISPSAVKQPTQPRNNFTPSGNRKLTNAPSTTTAVGSSQSPLKVDRAQIGVKVEEEIEALLRNTDSPPKLDVPSRKLVKHTPLAEPTLQATRVVPSPRPKEEKEDNEEVLPMMSSENIAASSTTFKKGALNKENIRTVSGHKPPASDMLNASGLRNVHMLSECMEAQRIVETPTRTDPPWQQWEYDNRPATADTARGSSVVQATAGGEQQSSSTLGRALSHSAPMLFKPSRSRQRRKTQKPKVDKEATGSDMEEVLSIGAEAGRDSRLKGEILSQNGEASDDEETPRTAAFYENPEAAHASETVAHAQVHFQHEEFEEEPQTSVPVDEAVSTQKEQVQIATINVAKASNDVAQSQPQPPSHPPPRMGTASGRRSTLQFRRRQTNSAKSRDSGYLGDSYSGSAKSFFSSNIPSDGGEY